MLSSRDDALGGRSESKHVCEQAVALGWTLVAGHNRPVYQSALLAAKRAGAPSVMVLDRGLLAAFDEDLRRDPIPAARIWGYGFDAEHSVAVSPFRLWDPWIGANARRRDELIAALADVIVALNIRENGVMHRVCAEALARGQRVLADAEALCFLGPLGAEPWTGTLPQSGGPAGAANG